MLRNLFVGLLIIHGFIHVIGFVNAWQLYSFKDFSGNTTLVLSDTITRLVGLAWLLACFLFIATAWMYGLHKEGWWLSALGAVLLSQGLIALYWSDAKVGTIANVLILAVTMVSFAGWRFQKNVSAEVDALLQNSSLKEEKVEERQLAHLPAAVQHWLKRSGVIGAPFIHTVRLKQEGLMRLKPAQKSWVKAYAVQYITIDQPAYNWQVKMELMPLLPVRGRDQFVNGHGAMNIKLFSLIGIVNAANEKVDQGALQRWLAEMCWYPSAALSPYIKWEEINTSTVKATMSYQGTTGSVHFLFTPDGDIAGVEAERYMGGGKSAALERWCVRCEGYGNFGGIRVPAVCEATWKLKSGDFTWFKLKITDIEFNKGQRYPVIKKESAVGGLIDS